VFKIQIEEVEEILNSSRLLALLAPQHVFITDESIIKKLEGQVIHFRGVAPKNRRGVMFLSRQANETTVPHEWVHAALGLGELFAYPFGNLMARKIEITRKSPLLKNLRLRTVKYREAEVPFKYSGRVKHYVKE